MISNCVLGALLYFDGDRRHYPWETVGENRNNPTLPVGLTIKSFNFFENDDDEFKNFIYESLSDENVITFQSIAIDYRLLKNDEIINILREKFQNKGYCIRIIGDNYQLTRDDLDKLDFFKSIMVDECDQSIIDNSVTDNGDIIDSDGTIIFRQNNLYKRDFSLNDDLNLQIDYFITDNLSQEDINRVVNTINNDPFLAPSTTSINLNVRFYNPALYKELLEKLNVAGLNKDVSISFLGNPLVDNDLCFSGLNNIVDNDLKIIYNTCQDMVDRYCNEPFVVNNSYISELEGGGKTDLANYSAILSTLERAEKHINDMQYSPLEAAVYCYRFLKSNYIYDPESDVTDQVDYNINRDLHNIVNRDRMVCVGYATLFSALLRRVGIPAFRYATDRHARNIARINDEKYGIDTIACFDPTWDCDNDFNLETYYRFMLSPRDLLKANDPEFLTIPHSLVLDRETYEQYISCSRSPYHTLYNEFYSPIGYSHTMLQLMKYNLDDSIEGFYNQIHELNNNSTFDEVSSDIIGRALTHVYKSENPLEIDVDDILMNWVNVSYDMRRELFSSNDRIVLNFSPDDVSSVVQVQPIQKNNTNSNYDIEVIGDSIVRNLSSGEINENDNEFISGTNIRMPRCRGDYESDAQYISYLANYYNDNFPLPKLNSDGTYNLRKADIIQDLPIYSNDVSSFFVNRMSDSQVKQSQELIGSYRGK